MSAPVAEFLTEIICLHSLAPWSWKRQQQNVEIRYSTNNDKITCIRCEIMNLPLKILTCDSMLENTDGLGSRGEYRRTRQSPLKLLQKFRCEVLSWVG